MLKRVAFNIKPLRLVSRADLREIVEQRASKEALLDRVSANLPPGDLVDGIATAWDAEDAALAEVWDERWSDLAPGADVLEQLFAEVGLHYDKVRDGARLAAATEPPEEILQALAPLLGQAVVEVQA